MHGYVFFVPWCMPQDVVGEGNDPEKKSVVLVVSHATGVFSLLERNKYYACGAHVSDMCLFSLGAWCEIRYVACLKATHMF